MGTWEIVLESLAAAEAALPTIQALIAALEKAFAPKLTPAGAAVAAAGPFVMPNLTIEQSADGKVHIKKRA